MEELLLPKGTAKNLLKNVEWQEGKIIPLMEAPYRYRIVTHCSSNGRQEAEFANGQHHYFCYMELIDGQGNWIKRGANIVPILPDGRFIMVVEQRPPQGRYSNRSMIALIANQEINLEQFGHYSSLEFPGGAVEKNEELKAGFLRELAEETGIENQTAIFFKRNQPIYGLGSDLAIQLFVGVVQLSGLSYKKRVDNDGGLIIFSLSRAEIEENIKRGVICSGQAALMPWSFYKDIEKDIHSLNTTEEGEYFSKHLVKITKQ